MSVGTQPVPAIYNSFKGRRVTVRVPTVITKCKVTAGVAVVAMTIGTLLDASWIRGWSLLIAVYAVGLCLRTAVDKGVEAVRANVKQWSHQVFQDGFRSGVEQGRAMEAAERFIEKVDRH